jgi:hypothetical protein
MNNKRDLQNRFAAGILGVENVSFSMVDKTL